MSRLEKSQQPTQETAEPSRPSQTRGGGRKRYSAPRLKAYGRLAELTRFGGSQVVDSGAGLGNQP